jgi:glucan phosphoethanolaminetransferase (alkaline phosphatase superfamily)
MLVWPSQSDARTDLDHGQIVIVTARWLMIGVGLVLTLAYPTAALGDLRLQVSLILLLAIANFYLHAQVIRGRPIPLWAAYAASGADLLVISLLVAAQGGFGSYRYVLYFPALLALSVAFDPAVTFVYAVATAVVYAVISMPTTEPTDAPIVVSRVLMLAAVAFCGAVYWRVERERRGIPKGSR